MKKGLKVIIAIVIISIIAGTIAYFVTHKTNNKAQDFEIAEVKDFSYFILKENNKYGVLDKSSNVVIEPIYDEVKIPNPEKEVFICYKDNVSKVFNSKGEQILTNYETVEPIRLKNVISNLLYEKTTLIYTKDGKMGLIDYSGNEITENKYESIETLPSQEGKLLVKQNGKVGVLNINGYELIKCSYDKIDLDGYYYDNSYQYSGFVVSNTTNEGYRYGYINYKGEEIIKPECSELSRVTEIDNKDDCYLILAKNGQFGVYKNKEKLINNEYQSIWYGEDNGVFVIEKSRKYGVADIKGKTILPLDYNQIDVTGICIYATTDDGVKTFDKNGKEIQMEENTTITNTENSKYRIQTHSDPQAVTYGVIDDSGNEIVPKDYSYIEYFADNYFIVSDMNGKLGIIDDKNNIILDLKYTSLQKVDGTNILQAGIVDGNTTSTELYSSKIEKICETKDGLIKTKGNYIYVIEDGTTYVDIETQKVVPNTEVFANNTLFAKKDDATGLWGFVDKSGTSKVDCIYDKVTEFNNSGYAGFKKGDKWGVINENGEVILEPTYTIQSDMESSVDFIGKYYSVEYGFGEVYYTNEIPS